MSLFKSFKPLPVPKDCEGLEIRTESSVCTGEKIIGFYDPVSKRLLCSELVRSDEDIRAFYKKYGRDPSDIGHK
ncbi:hypothetical protein SAMN02910317_02488 [Ruminococcaceae bacterium FB2012]|nr:hypothetical protein SAMN02910317_02488 [Ruminococcaceae bacterium FB2012]